MPYSQSNSRGSCGISLLRIWISERAPPAYQALVWEEFFSTRSRGISLLAHFPWLAIPERHTHYVLACVGSRIVGGLAVRAKRFESEMIGSIGLVCVHPDHRCEGIGKQLLEAAIDLARNQGYGALRLWTRQHSLYIRHGFVIADSSTFGTLERPAVTGKADFFDGAGTIIPHDISELGVPPFATRVEVLELNDATLTLIEDRHGLIVSTWEGDELAVVSLMERALPEIVRLNAFVDQALLPTLVERGWSLALEQCSLQMILSLDQTKAADWEPKIRIPVTARI